jgi:hypothetical protein
MVQVKIIEFSVQAQADFQVPVPFDEAQLNQIAKTICQPPVSHLVVAPREIALRRENALFKYDLSIPLLGGSAEIVINAQGASASFRQGRAKAHLKYIAESLVSILSASVRHPLRRLAATFSGHAVFDSPALYVDYMRQYTRGEPNVVSGGVVLTSSLQEWGGEVRYATEKSVAYDNALFVTCVGTTIRETISAEMVQAFFKSLGERFEEIAKVNTLEFSFAQ